MSSSTDVYVSLKERLSPKAKIYLQDSESFGHATLRWSQFKRPQFTVVVEVATEHDVVETVSLTPIELSLYLTSVTLILDTKKHRSNTQTPIIYFFWLTQVDTESSRG